jgi:hypothetical protein
MKSYEKMGRLNRSIVDDRKNYRSKSFENQWLFVFGGRWKNSSLHHGKKSKIFDNRHFFSEFTKTDHNVYPKIRQIWFYKKQLFLMINDDIFLTISLIFVVETVSLSSKKLCQKNRSSSLLVYEKMTFNY